MKHILQTIKPYYFVNMIVVAEIDNSKRSLWYLYNSFGELVKSGYGDRHLGIKAPRSALRNAKQAARRYIRKKHPLFFEGGKKR